MLFCVRCFASENDGSWGSVVVKDHCFNCGCGGSAIDIDEWSIKSIRESASWVGKRYYPSEEDYETNAELLLARKNLPIPPDRWAKEIEKGLWDVGQPRANGTISVFVHADSEKEAMDKARLQLPAFTGKLYIPEV